MEAVAALAALAFGVVVLAVVLSRGQGKADAERDRAEADLAKREDADRKYRDGLAEYDSRRPLE